MYIHTYIHRSICIYAYIYVVELYLKSLLKLRTMLYASWYSEARTRCRVPVRLLGLFWSSRSLFATGPANFVFSDFLQNNVCINEEFSISLVFKNLDTNIYINIIQMNFIESIKWMNLKSVFECFANEDRECKNWNTETQFSPFLSCVVFLDNRINSLDCSILRFASFWEGQKVQLSLHKLYREEN